MCKKCKLNTYLITEPCNNVMDLNQLIIDKEYEIIESYHLNHISDKFVVVSIEINKEEYFDIILDLDNEEEWNDRIDCFNSHRVNLVYKGGKSYEFRILIP